MSTCRPNWRLVMIGWGKNGESTCGICIRSTIFPSRQFNTGFKDLKPIEHLNKGLSNSTLKLKFHHVCFDGSMPWRWLCSVQLENAAGFEPLGIDPYRALVIGFCTFQMTKNENYIWNYETMRYIWVCLCLDMCHMSSFLNATEVLPSTDTGSMVRSPSTVSQGWGAAAG